MTKIVNPSPNSVHLITAVFLCPLYLAYAPPPPAVANNINQNFIWLTSSTETKSSTRTR